MIVVQILLARIKDYSIKLYRYRRPHSFVSYTKWCATIFTDVSDEK